MPWRGSFEPHAWGVASLMDFAVPVVACLLVWLLVKRESHNAGEYRRVFRFCIKKPTIKVGKRNDLYSLRETLHFSLSLLT